jgi:predicted ATPase
MRHEPISLKLGFGGADYGYAIDLGLAPPSLSRFGNDPEIKGESVWIGPVLGRGNLFAERRAELLRVRSADTGEWRESHGMISSFDSIMTHWADPTDGLELLALRERMRGWRFYDDLRTDRGAPARRPQIGTVTPILAGDGADLGAAIQTILEVGDGETLHDAIADAFDGAALNVGEGFQVEIAQPGLLRPLGVAELSDGTLRYILLVAALLSPRPPELMILNEPEASLHPDLLAPLARLLKQTAGRCQLIVVSHAQGLVDALESSADAHLFELEKELGETVVSSLSRCGWKWPTR